MKKCVITIIFAISFIQIIFAQSQIATGIIKNEAGIPIPGALVKEFKSESNAATYTDSIGFFSLTVGSFPKLKISRNGYNDTLINVTDKINIVVTLSLSKTAKTSSNIAIITDDPLINKNLLQDAVSTQSGITNNYVYGGGARNYTGSLMPVFTHKEETVGNRYLYDKWVHGWVNNTNNSVFNDPTYLYNYDKIEGGLLMTHDKQSAIEIDKSQIKSFSVYLLDKDNPLVFEVVPAIDNAHFVQVLSSGTKYTFYKLTKTKFIKSDYKTNGITESGNHYDEYVDENTFYAINNQTKQMQKLVLKKKAIKDVFAIEAEKLKAFYDEHSNDEISEIYLQNLGDYLNN